MHRATWSLFAALPLAHACVAADAPLAKLHGLLAPMRHVAAGDGQDHRGPYNAGSKGGGRNVAPAHVDARRMLRDWLELQLKTTPENVRERSFEARLNTGLRRNDLFCQAEGVDAPDRCAFEHEDWNPTGYIHSGIRVYRPVPGVLVIVAGLGIECGTDSSAYAYEWLDERWQRFWQSEQPIGKDWRPQGIDVVSVSGPDARGARHVMTLGNMDWCSSTFYPVYVRLWRTDPGRAHAKLLLDLETPAWLNAGDDITPPITGRVTLTEARFEFMRNDRIALESHEAVVTYQIRGDTLTRVDPVARSPQAFVLEWLDAPWVESRRWIGMKDAARVEPWHRKLKSGDLHTEYPTTNACRHPGAWQVTIDLSRENRTPGYSLYFGVSQVSPERFEIREVRTEPRAGCDGPGFGAIAFGSN